jgi:hypothetical protein
MACFLPFRPWRSPGPRVFRFRTTRDQSTDPTQVLSCTYAPPQWLALPRVTPPERLGRPFLLREVPRVAPRPFSVSKQTSPFLRLAFGQVSEQLRHAARKSRLQGLATLLTASAHPPSGTLFSSPRSWASPFRASFRLHGRHGVSPGPSAPTLLCQTLRPGTGAPAAYAREASGYPRSPALFGREWGPCPHGLRHLPGFFPPNLRRSAFLLRALRVLSIQPPKKPDGGTSRDSFRRPGTPLFRGAPTCLVFPTDCTRHSLET